MVNGAVAGMTGFLLDLFVLMENDALCENIGGTWSTDVLRFHIRGTGLSGQDGIIVAARQRQQNSGI
jgi:hypothetical protein